MNFWKKKQPEILKVGSEEAEVKADAPAPLPAQTQEQVQEQQPEEKKEEVISIEQVIVETYQKTLELERVTNLLLENQLSINTLLINASKETKGKGGRPRKE